MNIEQIKENTLRELSTIPSKAKSLLISLGKWLKKTFLNPSDAMKTFYCLLIISVLCYGYTWLNQSFTVPLSGDYSLQEMTFIYNGYDDWHTYFRTGVFPEWDRSAFLGIDNIGGNSFYYLFDPFMLILLPFPREWLLQLQGLEFVLKMGLAGMFFYWYLGEFNLSPKARRIGAIAFAFSGYSFNYLWFHFIDSVAFYPLVLLGVERIIKQKDPRIFLVGFFLNAMTSYFFFVVYMFGAFFYAIFRFFQTVKERDFDANWGVLGLGIFSFVVAIFLGCFTLLPGMSTALNMPRVSSSSYLGNIMDANGIKEILEAVFSYDTTTGTAHITPLLNFLFINDDCYSSNLLNVYFYDNFQSSLYATTPMLLLFFVSFIDTVREKRLDRFFAVVFTAFLIFTPIGFYLFSGFTVGYARYFIIPISWMIVYDCIAIEKRRSIPRTDLDISFVIVALLMALCCYLMVDFVQDNDSLFSNTEWDTKMALIPASMVWVCVCYGVMRPFFHKRHFTKAMLGLTAVDIIVMANCTIYFHGVSGIMSQTSQIDEETKIVQLLKADENNDDYYRIYNTTANRGNINISMREGYSGLGAFHSVYAFSCQDFIDRSRIPYSYHNWSMGIHNRRYNLETFLGTKYYLVDRIGEKSDSYGIPKVYPYQYNNGYPVYADDYDIPYGYKDVLTLTEEEKTKLGVNYSDELLSFLASDECDKTLYVNTDFVDFAFAFDTVINAYWLGTNLSYKAEEDDVYYNCYEDYNEYPLLRAAMLDDEDYQTFYKAKKYNAGTFTMNGVTHTYTNEKLSQNATAFQSSLYTTSPYEKGVTSPIEIYQSNSKSSKNKLKVTVYAANWPATVNNPSGEYASCAEDDPSDTTCVSDYMKTNPVEYANGIRPADTKYDYETLTDDNGEKKDTYNRHVLYNSKIVITPIDPVTGEDTVLAPEADPNDPATGCYISIFDQDQIEWRLIDQNGSVISYAMHSYSDYKQAHGYYTDRPVAKIIGIVKTGSKSSPVNLKRPYVYVQRNSDYQEAIDNLRKEPVDITYRVDDEVDFTTNYSSDKFVVLNYPKANGWTLKEISYDEKNGENIETEVDLYKAQGGFIGFEAKSGEHKYVLSYSAPYFKLGEFITLIGLLITFGCFVFFGKKKKEEHGLDDVFSLGKARDESIRMIQYKYDNFEEHLK